jgi:hypothetical protein
LPDGVDNDHQLKPVQYPDDKKPEPIPPPPSAGSPQWTSAPAPTGAN